DAKAGSSDDKAGSSDGFDDNFVLEQLDKALDETPDDVSLWLAVELMGAQRQDQEQQLRGALGRAASANSSQLRSLLLERAAQIYAQQGDSQSAQATLEQALDDGANLGALRSLERLAVKNNDFQEAAELASRTAASMSKLLVAQLNPEDTSESQQTQDALPKGATPSFWQSAHEHPWLNEELRVGTLLRKALWLLRANHASEALEYCKTLANQKFEKTDHHSEVRRFLALTAKYAQNQTTASEDSLIELLQSQRNGDEEESSPAFNRFQFECVFIELIERIITTNSRENEAETSQKDELHRLLLQLKSSAPKSVLIDGLLSIEAELRAPDGELQEAQRFFATLDKSEQEQVAPYLALYAIVHAPPEQAKQIVEATARAVCESSDRLHSALQLGFWRHQQSQRQEKDQNRDLLEALEKVTPSTAVFGKPISEEQIWERFEKKIQNTVAGENDTSGSASIKETLTLPALPEEATLFERSLLHALGDSVGAPVAETKQKALLHDLVREFPHIQLTEEDLQLLGNEAEVFSESLTLQAVRLQSQEKAASASVESSAPSPSSGDALDDLLEKGKGSFVSWGFLLRQKEEQRRHDEESELVERLAAQVDDPTITAGLHWRILLSFIEKRLGSKTPGDTVEYQFYQRKLTTALECDERSDSPTLVELAPWIQRFLAPFSDASKLEDALERADQSSPETRDNRRLERLCLAARTSLEDLNKQFTPTEHGEINDDPDTPTEQGAYGGRSL
ncbi:MAG: hypothetical protein MK135_16970, partial [Polyangiaceae bacterium]|nr:hypothetical protein [Polyangiaceae bacterium]